MPCAKVEHSRRQLDEESDFDAVAFLMLIILSFDRDLERDRKRATCDSTGIGCDWCIDISSFLLEDHSGS